MEFIDSNSLFDKIKELINSAEKSVLLITKELSDEIAELLLLKASKGIHVKVITKDANWADWLESKKNSYGTDELRNYQKEIDSFLKSEKRYKTLEIITPIILIPVLLVVGIFIKQTETLPYWSLFLFPAIGAIISGLLDLRFHSLTKKSRNQLTILQSMISQREAELQSIREEIQKNLEVKLDKKVGFTLLLIDDKKNLLTPLSLCIRENENKNEITFFDELPKEELQKILEKFN